MPKADAISDIDMISNGKKGGHESVWHDNH